jgi:hypothetical protein
VLTVIGAGSVAFGLLGVLKGGDGVIDGGPVSANVDSEIRFFSAWYAVLGVLVLRAARRPESETIAVRACGGGFLLAAVGRMLSRRAAGAPAPLFQVLTAAEFAIPAVIVPWQATLRRKTTTTNA